MDLDEEFGHAEALAETGFWGRRGAGCVVYARSTGRLLLARRSCDVLEPGTWGTWGGAVEEGADAAACAARELEEETGCSRIVEMVPVYEFVDASSGFRYSNFLAVVDDEFVPKLNWENDGFAWVEQGEWPSPLHFGLADLIDNVPDLACAAAGSACGTCPSGNGR